ncbi:hypothetical protein [Rhodanobacter ginsengiterrae]|uniref:hypothetical protein n=1 Tax=Rhodanobacter ginsengiterrae TaxID=2008451 RepID=UPI003CF5ACC2
MTRKREDIEKHGRLKNPGPLSHGEVVLIQRKTAREFADCIERGETFSVVDVVAMLRARADQKWRGRRPDGAPASREPERSAIRSEADKIEAGEPFDAQLVANALRRLARALPSTPRPTQGRPTKVDHAAIALEFEAQRLQRPDVSTFQLTGELAEKYGVDESTITAANVACGDRARRHFKAFLCDFGARWDK